MIYVYQIENARPLSVNHIYRNTKTGGRYMTQKAKDLKEQIQWKLNQLLLTGDVRLDVTYYLKGSIDIDVDNPAKLVLDACSGMLFEDDAQVVELNSKKVRNCAGFGIEIQIQPC